MKIGILDYGIGNLNSLANAFRVVGGEPFLVNKPINISQMDRCVLPGVGGFEASMNLLKNGGWVDAISEQVLENKMPILGICLGMQLFASWGSECTVRSKKVPGLNFINGEVESMAKLGCQARLPHMGWNNIAVKVNHPMFKEIKGCVDYYFVHSYAFTPTNCSHVLATVTHEIEFVSAVSKDNIWGVQFHPEKSSKAGLQLLKNFIGDVKC
jgi:imidazole glycerol-phosphate synthase subunit HisH